MSNLSVMIDIYDRSHTIIPLKPIQDLDAILPVIVCSVVVLTY